MVVIQEIFERQLQPPVLRECCHTGHQACRIAIGSPDILQNVLGSFLFQLNITALGSGDKSIPDFPGDAPGGIAEQCCKLILKVIFFVGLADKIQHSQALLVFCQTETAAQLLQEHSQGLCGAQKENRVDLRDVHTFVVDVYHENEADLSFHQPLLGSFSLLLWGASGQIHGGNAMFVKIAAHELGIFDGHTKTQALYVIHVRDILQKRCHHQICPAICRCAAEGVKLGQFTLVISASAPFQGVQVHIVRDPKVLEGAQQLSVDGFRQTDFCGNAIMEIRQDALAVHTFRRSGQAQQDLRLIVAQQSLVYGSSGMVEFVHDDVIIKIRQGFCGKILRIEGLDGDKEIVNAVWLIAAHKHLTEISILQHRPEGVQALFEDFLPVGNKQQAAGSARVLPAEALIVQGGNHRFAGAGSRNHQIAVVSPNPSFRLQLIENLLLIIVGRDFQGIYLGIVGILIFFRFQRTGKALPLVFAVILKFAGIPVAFKGSPNLINGLRQIFSRHLHIPLQTAGDSGIGQVG